VSTEPAVIGQDLATSTIDSLSLGKQITIDSNSLTSLDHNQQNQEIIDIVQQSLNSDDTDVSCAPELKERVVNRAKELDSVQQAASEFSLPWRIVALWLVDQSQTKEENSN